MRKKKRWYHCKHCGRTVERDVDKAWVKSYCAENGKDVHLMQVKKPKR